MAYGACYLKGTRRPRWYDCRGLSSFLYWDSSLRACLPFLIKNDGSARESAGNNRKEGVRVAAAPTPLLSQWGSRFGIY